MHGMIRIFISALSKTQMSTVRDQIIANANAIRLNDPGTYGVKGVKKGNVGWVPDGWKKAIIDSAASYRQQAGIAQRPRKPKRQYTDEQKKYRKGYLHELREVKKTYAPFVPGVSAKKERPKALLKPKIEPVYLYKNPGFASFSAPTPTTSAFTPKRRRDPEPVIEFESY